MHPNRGKLFARKIEIEKIDLHSEGHRFLHGFKSKGYEVHYDRK